MKKIVFTLAAIFSLSLLTPVFASGNTVDHRPKKYFKGYGEAITFVENGITFSIFQNGEFDFYINPREGLYAGVDFGNVSISYNSGYNYDPYVQYDDYGAIIQIENVPIYYDYYGRIIRAGDVRINYYGRRLHRVGGLRVHYNVHGHYTHCSGYINRYNRHYVYHPFHSFFIAPIYTHSIISYKPYRKYYTPKRYRYDYGKRYTNKYYKKHRRYKNVTSRVRNKSDRRTVYNRGNTSKNDRGTNTVRRSTVRNNRAATSAKRSTVNSRKPVKRTTLNRRSSTNDRVIERGTKNVRSRNSKASVERNDKRTIRKSPPIRSSSVSRTTERKVTKRQPVKRQVSKRSVERRPTSNYKRSSARPDRKSTHLKRGSSQRQTATKNRSGRN